MIQPRTQQGRTFLIALNKLMRAHKVKCITGWDDGTCWLVFDEDNHTTNIEPDLFDLSQEELDNVK